MVVEVFPGTVPGTPERGPEGGDLQRRRSPRDGAAEGGSSRATAAAPLPSTTVARKPLHGMAIAMATVLATAKSPHGDRSAQNWQSRGIGVFTDD
jgi:hypothetical protein